jgi:hypothetical protein
MRLIYFPLQLVVAPCAETIPVKEVYSAEPPTIAK